MLVVVASTVFEPGGHEECSNMETQDMITGKWSRLS